MTQESADTLYSNVTLSSTFIQQSTDNSTGNKYYILMKILEYFLVKFFLFKNKNFKTCYFLIKREHILKYSRAFIFLKKF